MTKESLLELKQAINEYLTNKSKMNEFDRLELIINMNHFLEPKMYEENCKVLEMNRRKYDSKRNV